MIQIVTDSSSYLPVEYLRKHNIHIVPLTINIDGAEYLEGIDISAKEFWKLMADSPNLPKTAQPSPASFGKLFKDLSLKGDQIICLTLSSYLSGTFQSACLAKKLTNTDVVVFDTLSAGAGHALQVMKAVELIQQGLSLDEVIKRLTEYRDNMEILILLDTLENIVKGGRLNKVQGSLAKILNIKALAHGVNGEVELLGKVRGKHNFYNMVLKIIGEKKGPDFSNTVFGIAHADNLEDAQYYKKEIIKLYKPKDVIILDMGPTISTYTGPGGITLAF